MSRYLLALTVGCLVAGIAAAADPPKVDRTIRKEPAYRTKSPRYGLLTFGPEARDRVWLVLDGDTLFVDRNGDGDLTGPGETVAAKKTPDHNPGEDGYTFDVGDVTVGGRTHKGLAVSFTPLKRYADTDFGKLPSAKAALAKDPNAMAAMVMAEVEVPGVKGGGIGGRAGYTVGMIDLNGVLQFAESPAAAPVVWLGGPLQVTFYGERPKLRVGRTGELVLVVGTPGDGPGTFAMVRFQDTIPDEAKPVAEVTYPPAKPGDPPFKEKYEIKERC